MAAIEQLLADFFATNPPGAAAVYLFGSTARGTARPESDIDLGVLFSDAPPATLDAQPYEHEHALEKRLGRPVEVVVLNRAAIDLRSRVLPIRTWWPRSWRSSKRASPISTASPAGSAVHRLVRTFRSARHGRL